MVASFHAHTPASLGTLRRARSQIEPEPWRGKAWHGRASPAFELVESGVVTGPPPIPRRRPPRATNRMTKPPPPRRKLLADSGSEPGVNASPLFKEPAARTTQHDGRARSRVGWTLPAPHAKTDSLGIERPIRTLAVPRFSDSSVESGSLSFMRKLSP